MPRTTTLLAAIALTACATTPPKAPTDRGVTEYLLSSAATDLRSHASATRVRAVRLGHLATPDGGTQYLLCGELQATGEAGWIPFATTKTSGYEQAIGALATTACQRPAITWDGDLSAALQSRL